METENLISIHSICSHYQVEVEFVDSLSDYELIEIVKVEEEQFLHKEQLGDFERLMRLHYDLEINLAGIDVIAQLLQKINRLEAELKNLK